MLPLCHFNIVKGMRKMKVSFFCGLLEAALPPPWICRGEDGLISAQRVGGFSAEIASVAGPAINVSEVTKQTWGGNDFQLPLTSLDPSQRPRSWKFYRLLPVPLATFYLKYFMQWNNRRGRKPKASRCCRDDKERGKSNGKLGWQANGVERYRPRKE